MHPILPYRVIPKLIAQPTWGGDYIMRHKGYHPLGLEGKKIGQSYELFQGSLLQPIQFDTTTAALGDATSADITLVGTEQYRDEIFPLAELMAEDPVAVLGSAVVNRYGAQMPLLLKMNQALGNSYQLHIKYADESAAVREAVQMNPWISPVETGGYLAKPESWYYLEPGLATIGLSRDCDVAAYRQVCLQIQAEMERLSALVQSGQLSLAEASAQVESLIAKLQPSRYVNRVEIPAGQVVDLSQGGVHHSWEADLVRYPLGNIVYEIQLDRMDTISTLRAFDQGKFKPDGSVRPLNIEDYFAHLDTSPAANDPLGHLLAPEPLGDTDAEGGRYQLVRTEFYALDLIKLSSLHSLRNILGGESSFAHLFVKSGNVQVYVEGKDYLWHRGESYFLPADWVQNSCNIGTFRGQEAEVLIAYVPK